MNLWLGNLFSLCTRVEKNAKSVRIWWLVLAKCCQHKTLRRHNVISFVYNVLQLIHLHCVCGCVCVLLRCRRMLPARFQPQDNTTKGIPSKHPLSTIVATALNALTANVFRIFRIYWKPKWAFFVCFYRAVSKMVQVWSKQDLMSCIVHKYL